MVNQEREKVKQKIIKLLNVTISNGSGEQEALTAAEQAAKLMEHYDIKTSELQIRNSKAIQKEIPFNRYMKKHVGGTTMMHIAKLVDCMYWHSPWQNTWTLFGLPQDVEIGEYLYSIISEAVMYETKQFGFSDEYRSLRNQGYSKLGLRLDFMQGMEDRISNLLSELLKNRKVAFDKETTGRSLVLLKESLIKEEFQKAGIKLHYSSGYGSGRSSSSKKAKEAGWSAGSRVSLTTGVGSSSQGRLS